MKLITLSNPPKRGSTITVRGRDYRVGITSQSSKEQDGRKIPITNVRTMNENGDLVLFDLQELVRVKATIQV